jgi:hypothetical protein
MGSPPRFHETGRHVIGQRTLPAGIEIAEQIESLQQLVRSRRGMEFKMRVLHLIVDNYSAHKHPKVKALLARRPRFHLHFTPTSASWLNLVERFFRDLTQQALLPGSFQSVTQLVDAIDSYLAQHNLAAKRYVWRADGTEVLRKIDRAWKAALEE